jgi:NAD(P)-dependent dehydrogenase (short-subunit alcohol dehydrogenase family)
VGRAAALLLNRSGWQVFAIVRKRADADALEAAAGGGLKALLADVTRRDEVFSAARQIDASLGERGLDGLICNAGVGGGGPLEFAPIEELTAPVETNLYGSLFCAQAFLPLLRKAKGRIINVTSGSTLFTMPLVSTYPAAKYALELLTRQLQSEVKHFGVRVILVDPGTIKTRMTLEASESSRAVREKLPPEAIALYGNLIDALQKATDRMAGSGKEPDQVAQVYLRALTDPRPKDLYLVGADAKIMRAMSRIAPQRVLNAVAARALSK